ncbi:unnamed protein product [Clavelina lepadiformis]|uniref:Uncharacterized protein n=1 Tax=Clavelina lepadiformis TaxID=159417 RepID=A0ABP0GD86_CLALP
MNRRLVIHSKERTLITQQDSTVNRKEKVARLAERWERYTEASAEPHHTTLRIILEHLSNLVVELNSRFSDLKLMKFPSWITQRFLFNCASEEGLAMDYDLADELLHLQNDDSIKPIYASKNKLIWLDSQVCTNVVTDILTKKRGTLDICKRGDLRAKLTNFSPRFSLLTSQHEAHGSH